MKIQKYTNGAWTDLDKPVKKYDTYTDEATTLPLTIEASATDAIENYQVYGTSAGAGVETENLWDKATALIGYRVTASGVIENSIYACSDFIEVIEGEEITVSSKPSITNFYFFTANKSYISYAEGDTATVPSTAKYVRCNLSVDKVDTFMLVKGSIAPTSYIPYGYKIPILNTSGVTENLFDPNATDTSKGYAMSKQFNENGEIVSKSGWFISEYIEIESNQSYTLWYRSVGFTSVLYYCLYDVNKNLIRVIGSNESIIQQVFTTTSTEKYIRFCEPNSVKQETMIQQGNISEYNYVPHRYESNYDLMIGDSKLYEDEYLDFVEQKVYKRTENKYDDSTTTDNYRIIWATGALNPDSNYRISDYISVSESTSLTFSGLAYCIGYDANKTYLGVWNGEAYKKDGTARGQTTITIPSGTAFIRLTSAKALMTSEFMVVANTTVPASFIPYLQPTDPPVPLPAIQTYQGENNLSVDTTVQPEKVAVEYEGWKGVGDVEKYQNGEWSDNNDT